MKYTYEKKNLPQEVLEDGRISSFSPAIHQILANRGYNTTQKIEELLFTSLDSMLEDVSMTDSEKAINILQKNLENREKIVVYRDYDCDGCSSGAIALECLRNLGGDVEQHANTRAEGYGLMSVGIDQILEKFPDTKTILTVDNGIVAYEGINYAKKRGLQVLVTDHHEMGEDLPAADAVVNPKRRDEESKFRTLCGAGVIFKVMIGLYRQMGQDFAPVLATLDLVALATVADVVPMLGENRVLVQEGIQRILQGNRPFFNEVKKQLKLQSISAHSELGFQLAPLVNACSRMEEDTNLVVEAMLAESGSELEVKVSQLISWNNQRKNATKKATEKVDQILADSGFSPEKESAILVKCEDVSSGLVGLVAGRLKSKYNMISAIFHVDEGQLKGSIRGVEGFHLKEALDQIPEGVLTAYGGHAKAAGLSMNEENYDIFAECFIKLVKQAFPDGPNEEERNIDVALPETAYTVATVEELSVLEPFGEEFSPPLFGMTAEVVEQKFIGKAKNHVSYRTQSGVTVLRWGYADIARTQAHPPSKFVGTPQLNHWNGRVSVQFIGDQQ